MRSPLCSALLSALLSLASPLLTPCSKVCTSMADLAARPSHKREKCVLAQGALRGHSLRQTRNHPSPRIRRPRLTPVPLPLLSLCAYSVRIEMACGWVVNQAVCAVGWRWRGCAVQRVSRGGACPTRGRVEPWVARITSGFSGLKWYGIGIPYHF